MNITLVWNKPAGNIDFYVIRYAKEGEIAEKIITPNTCYSLDLTPGIWTFEVVACFADELCSVPAIYRYWIPPDEITGLACNIRLLPDGVVVGWNAEKDKSYLLLIGHQGFWAPGPDRLTGDGYTETNVLPPGNYAIGVLV